MITELREKTNKLITKRDLLLEQLEEKKESLIKNENYYDRLIRARWVVTEVIRLTQENFKNKVEPLITMAVQAVFEKDYKFELIFERKRNQFECRPVLMENGIERTAKDDLGGSVVDIISIAFRVVMMAIERPRSRALIVLDEPMKNVGQQEELILAGQMWMEISKKLKMQIILITHMTEFAEIAETVFEVVNDGVQSIVKKIKPVIRKRQRIT